MTTVRRDAGAVLAALAALAAAAAASGGPSWRAPFLWDDYILVVRNDGVAGLDPERLRWMFTTLYQTTYQPLGWLAIALVRRAAGLNAAHHHLVNLIAHWTVGAMFGAACLRLFRAANRKNAEFAAFAAALLFLVHPAQTFTAGWITELPDMLATFSFAAAVFVYLGDRSGQKRAAVLGLFAVSLLFRWKGICLPFILSVLDWWPLRRDWRSLLREKIPFWVLAAAALAVNAAAKLGSSIGPSFDPAAVARGLALFGRLLAWPYEILPLYSLRDPDTSAMPAALTLGLVAGVAALLWLGRRRRPAALAAGLFFAAALGPPLLSGRGGALVVYPHYAYLAGLPFFALAGAGLSRLRSRAAAAVLLALLAGVWARESARQSSYRRDEAVFWTRALALDRSSLMSYINLSDALARAGRGNDAYFYLQAQAAYNPDDAGARANAIEHLELLFRREPRLKPDLVEFWSSVADDYTAAGRPRDALVLCGKALQRSPRRRRAHAAAARAFEALGDARRAGDHRRAS